MARRSPPSLLPGNEMARRSPSYLLPDGVQDVVETQLMREISCRSRAMFEAAGELHDLHRSLCQTLDQIKVGVGFGSDLLTGIKVGVSSTVDGITQRERGSA